MPSCKRYYSRHELEEKRLDEWKVYETEIKRHMEDNPESKNAHSFWGLRLPPELKAAAYYFYGGLQKIYCSLVNESLLEKRQVDFYKAAKLYSYLFGHHKTIGNWRKSNMQDMFYLLLGTQFTKEELGLAQAASQRQQWIEGVKCDIGKDFALRVRDYIKPLCSDIDKVRPELESREEATCHMNYFDTLAYNVDELLSKLQNGEDKQTEREKVNEILERLRLLPNLTKRILDLHAKKMKRTKPARHKSNPAKYGDSTLSYVFHEPQDDDDD